MWASRGPPSPHLQMRTLRSMARPKSRAWSCVCSHTARDPPALTEVPQKTRGNSFPQDGPEWWGGGDGGSFSGWSLHTARIPAGQPRLWGVTRAGSGPGVLTFGWITQQSPFTYFILCFVRIYLFRERLCGAGRGRGRENPKQTPLEQGDPYGA